MGTIDITIQEAPESVGAELVTDEQDEDPGTTAWQLKSDTITHSFKDPAVQLPLPVDAASKDQIRNIVVDLGLRTEEIRLTGILVDRNTPGAGNTRKQTLLDLARSQFTKTINLEGGSNSAPSNPNSYLLLTLGSGIEPSDPSNSFSVGSQIITEDVNNTGTSTTNKSYRGLITELTLTQRGGRPDIWNWSMTFFVVMNEHDY